MCKSTLTWRYADAIVGATGMQGERRSRMLRRLAGECSDGVTCPTVYVDDRDPDAVIVQGYAVPGRTVLEVQPAAGEDLVRIPRAVLLEAARHLTEVRS
jgi:hypothetical protein